MKRFFPLIAIFLSVTLLLSGCVSSSPGREDASRMLPPDTLPYAPPGENDQPREERTVQLYLPDLQGTRLIAVHEKIVFNPFIWYGETLLHALFFYDGNQAQSLPRKESLALLGPVEVSNGVATVNLSHQALSLSHEQLYIVFQAITNTLCQFGDITAVNLLIGQVQPGVDAASRMSAGALEKNYTDDLTTLWMRAAAQKSNYQGTGRLTQNVSLYFPSVNGTGIVCENRALTFSSNDLSKMASTLLEALSAGSQGMTKITCAVPFSSWLSNLPSIQESAGERILTLRFSQSFPQALTEQNISLSSAFAALIYTMTTYLPGITGVEIYLGQDKISSLMLPSGENITFSNGILRRNQFANLLLSPCTLYFANSKGTLSACQRLISSMNSRHPGEILNQLILGPMAWDKRNEELFPVLPPVSANDITGMTMNENGVLLVNLSPRFQNLCQHFSPDEEKRMVYAMVNTFTELGYIREVCFFFNGRQTEFFSSAISMPGTFLKNPDIISNSRSTR